MIIGITGGIGSGKSTIARALAARGFAVYDCDKEAKRIIAENHDVQQQIINLFGPEAFVNRGYNTSYVAQRVFAEPELLERLNQIVHPAVKEDILSLPSTGRLGGAPVLFIESAILYEAGLDSICDKIIMVDAPEDIRIARTIARDYKGDASQENIDKVRARIRAQRSPLLHGGIERGLIVLNDGLTPIDQLVSIILQDITTL